MRRMSRMHSRVRQRGFLRLSMFAARWGSQPFRVQDGFRAGEPGVHFETYDPNTILKRRNLALWSEDIGKWSVSAASVALDAIAAPDGTVTADRLIEDGTTGGHRAITPGISFFSGKNYTFSVYLKQATRRYGQLTFPTAAFSTGGGISVDLQTGTIVQQNAGITASGVIDSGNGWWRCWCTRPCDITATSTPSVWVAATSGEGVASGHAGNGTGDIYVWGSQIDDGSAPTPYQKVTDWSTEFMAAGGDRVTMFSDNFCTTPITSVEQTIGGFVSTERGTARGPEMNDPATWAAPPAGVAKDAVAGTVTFSGTQAAFAAMNINGAVGVVNQFYEVRFVVSGLTQGAVQVKIGSAASNFVSANGPYRMVFMATAATNAVVQENGSAGSRAIATVSGISIKPLPGVAATQPTLGFKPKLEARVNMLVKTQELDDAAWTKTDVTITGNAIAAPDGAQTADLATEGSAGTGSLVQPATLSAASVPVKIVVHLKRGNTDWVRLNYFPASSPTNLARQWVNLATGSLGQATAGGAGTSFSSASTIEALGNGWYRVSMWVVTTLAAAVQLNVTTATGDGATGRVSGGAYHLWGADIRTAADAALDIPAYQRVNTASDYDTDGFPHRVRGDGIDDYLSVPLNLSGVNAVDVWVSGSLKQSDAASGSVFEFTATSSTTAGSFGLITPNVGVSDVQFRSGGTTPGVVKAAAVGAYPGPLNAVAFGSADIAAPSVSLDVNGVSSGAPTATTQGTGNYANDTLYILRRGGASLPSGAGFCALTLRGGARSDAGFKAKMLRAHARLSKIKV